MSRFKLIIIVILVLIILILIGWKLSDTQIINEPPITQNEMVYQSEYAKTSVFSPNGVIQYQLVANNIKYSADSNESWFIKPTLILFNNHSVSNWKISADSAKLVQKHLLYLYGNVEIKSLDPSSPLQTIETKEAEVDLITLDITSDTEVKLTGQDFSSNGLKMHGNLRDKHAELIDKVKTIYEMRP